MITGKNQIGYTLSAQGEVAHRTLNPITNTPNPIAFSEATADEIEKAVQLAKEAFVTFRKVPGTERAAFLNAIADEILALDQTLIDSYMSESGLPEGRALGERGRTVGQLRAFAQLIADEAWRGNTFDAAMPNREPLPKADHRKTSIAMGPVVVFSASNFPLAFSTAGGDTASALAAGCPVIVKAHEMHSGTSELVATAICKAAERTGMPQGVFSHLQGRGTVVGQALVKHPEVKAVGFTGSQSGGRALFNLAAARPEPIPVFAEMGSINPVIITPDALSQRKESITTTYAQSITLGAGQFCTNPGLIILISDANTPSFLEDLAEKTTAIAPQSMLHPNIASRYRENCSTVLSESKVSTCGQVQEVGENQGGAAIATLSGDTFLANPKTHQEVFGPFSLVVQCKDEAQLMAVINGLEGQLTGTLLAEDNDSLDLPAIVDSLQNKVGRIIFNGVPTGVEVCPSMHHGGPYPASTDSRYTAVGTHAIKRWVRPICYQSFPEALLPKHLQNNN